MRSRCFLQYSIHWSSCCDSEDMACETSRTYRCLQKKKPKRLRTFRELFVNFSRSSQKSSEVFGSFRKFTKFSDAFGCVRMCSNSSWLKKNGKPKRNDWTQNMHFYDVLRSCVKTELATPHPTDRNKTKKTKYV